MKKTTIYLRDKELRDLKILATKLRHGSAAELIRQAVSEFLKKKKSSPSFSYLKKHLRKKTFRTSFGDPVAFQRSLRKEWE